MAQQRKEWSGENGTLLMLQKMVCIGCGAVWLAEERNRLLRGVCRSEMFARIFPRKIGNRGQRGISRIIEQSSLSLQAVSLNPF